MNSMPRTPLTSFIVYAIALFVVSPCAYSLDVWACSSLHRVARNDIPQSTRQISLVAAKGEYAPFQIVVTARTTTLQNVTVTASDLVSAGGSIIPKKNLSLYREHYVYVDKSSPDYGGTNRPLGQGWYPDALIPFVHPVTGADLTGTLDAHPFSVSPQSNQPIWVDLFIPPGAEAGFYHGTMNITSSQGSAQVEIKLRVWDFELSRAPTLRSTIPLTQYFNKPVAERELLRHRLMPMMSTATNLSSYVSEFGLSMMGLPITSGANYHHCVMTPSPSTAALTQLASSFPEPLDKYIWVADEIDNCPELFPSVIQWAQRAHEANIKTLIPMAPTPLLFSDGSPSGRSAVDIWVTLPKMWETSSPWMRAAIEKGDEVWSYNAMAQDSYSPKWLIDYTLINYRIQPGFISQSLGVKGLLYWRADWWPKDPWLNVNTTGLLDENNYPGDGMLVYPGARVGLPEGFVPSMRLKQIREGVEDYDLLEQVKRSGQ